MTDDPNTTGLHTNMTIRDNLPQNPAGSSASLSKGARRGGESPPAKSSTTNLKPCPFCGCEVMPRHALWASDGDVDSIIHAEPSPECGLGDFSVYSADGGKTVAVAWNRRVLEQAISLLCGVHLRAMEFDDWEVRMGAMPETPWDRDGYVEAWSVLRDHLLRSRTL